MTQLKLIVTVACVSFLFVGSATAQAGWRYWNGPPVRVYRPIVVPPPPVVVGPAYAYPVYAYPPPPVPLYGPPVYRYGPFGRRGIVVGGPGVGVYVVP